MSYIGQKPAERILTSADISDAAITAAKLASAAVTQPKVDSGVAGTGPAFSAYMATNQNVSAATDTKAAIDTKTFDTASCFNNTGSTVGGIPAYSFLPNVAGYYQINGNLTTYSTNTSLIAGYVFIAKNGIYVSSGSVTNVASALYFTNNTSVVVYLNGTTDYVSLYGSANVTSVGSQLFIGAAASPQYTAFNGCLIRAA